MQITTIPINTILQGKISLKLLFTVSIIAPGVTCAAASRTGEDEVTLEKSVILSLDMIDMVFFKIFFISYAAYTFF